MTELSKSFVHFVAESLSLPTHIFDAFIGQMSRMKLIKYPQAAPGSQGVGPHKDSIGLFTFLSQDAVGGLQVLNKAGEWIDAPYVEGSLVVNIAQGFEAITGGVCSATTHRVVVGLYAQVLIHSRVWTYQLCVLVSCLESSLQHTIFPSRQARPYPGRTEAVCFRHCCKNSCF